MLGAVSLFGAGAPFISIGCPKAISIWFEGRNRGTAVGIYLTGPWIGGIVALTLTNSLVMPLVGQSWRHTFLLYGMLTVAAGAIWWLLARDAGPSVAADAPGMIGVFRALIKVRNVWIVLALGLLTFATLHALTNWLPKILEAGGLSPATAGVASALPLAAGIPALLVVPGLIPPPLRGRFLACSALVSLGTLIAILTGSGHVQLAALVLFGIAISPCYPILTLILMDAPEVGSKYMGSAGGMFFCVAEIGGFSGPLALGAIVDIAGSFLAGIFFFAALSLAAFVLALRLRPGQA
jgi:cyanate permease